MNMQTESQKQEKRPVARPLLCEDFELELQLNRAKSDEFLARLMERPLRSRVPVKSR